VDASQVRQRVQAIADQVDDPEAAHSLEDDLFADVLTIIAQESRDDHARALAGAALEARKIEFERWFA
jgi:DNA invertase Pin-like site-specific DNA recombinase